MYRVLVLLLIFLVAIYGKLEYTPPYAAPYASIGVPSPVPQSIHIPMVAMTSPATFVVPYWLGGFAVTTPTPANWVLPLTVGNQGKVLPGEFLQVRNYGPANITLLTTIPETIEMGPSYTVQAGGIVKVLSNYPNWVVTSIFTVTNASCGMGLICMGTQINLAPVGTPGAYNYPTAITTDTYGRVNSVTSGSQPITSVVGNAPIVSTCSAGVCTESLAAPGPATQACQYGSSSYDANGRLVSCINGSQPITTFTSTTPIVTTCSSGSCSQSLAPSGPATQACQYGTENFDSNGRLTSCINGSAPITSLAKGVGTYISAANTVNTYTASVKDFGVIGNGNDETTNITAAIKSCVPLFWPPGTYYAPSLTNVTTNGCDIVWTLTPLTALYFSISLGDSANWRIITIRGNGASWFYNCNGDGTGRGLRFENYAQLTLTDLSISPPTSCNPSPLTFAIYSSIATQNGTISLSGLSLSGFAGNGLYLRSLVTTHTGYVSIINSQISAAQVAPSVPFQGAVSINPEGNSVNNYTINQVIVTNSIIAATQVLNNTLPGCLSSSSVSLTVESCQFTGGTLGITSGNLASQLSCSVTGSTFANILDLGIENWFPTLFVGGSYFYNISFNGAIKGAAVGGIGSIDATGNVASNTQTFLFTYFSAQHETYTLIGNSLIQSLTPSNPPILGNKASQNTITSLGNYYDSGSWNSYLTDSGTGSNVFSTYSTTSNLFTAAASSNLLVPMNAASGWTKTDATSGLTNSACLGQTGPPCISITAPYPNNTFGGAYWTGAIPAWYTGQSLVCSAKLLKLPGLYSVAYQILLLNSTNQTIASISSTPFLQYAGVLEFSLTIPTQSNPASVAYVRLSFTSTFSAGFSVFDVLCDSNALPSYTGNLYASDANANTIAFMNGTTGDMLALIGPGYLYLSPGPRTIPYLLPTIYGANSIKVGTPYGQSLATNAGTGFLVLPTMPGTPTGTPVGASITDIPIVYDTAHNALWAYNAAWQQLTGTGVTSISGTANQIVASASTGPVTLSLPTSVTGVSSITPASGATSWLVQNPSAATILQSTWSGTVANYPQLTAVPTTFGVNYGVAGTDANIGVNLQSKGAGQVYLIPGGSTISFSCSTASCTSSVPLIANSVAPQSGQFFFVNTPAGNQAFSVQWATTNTANLPLVTAAPAGSGVSYSTGGSDTNIPVTLSSKGTGPVYIAPSGIAALTCTSSGCTSAGYIQSSSSLAATTYLYAGSLPSNTVNGDVSGTRVFQNNVQVVDTLSCTGATCTKSGNSYSITVSAGAATSLSYPAASAGITVTSTGSTSCGTGGSNTFTCGTLNAAAGKIAITVTTSGITAGSFISFTVTNSVISGSANPIRVFPQTRYLAGCGADSGGGLEILCYVPQAIPTTTVLNIWFETIAIT